MSETKHVYHGSPHEFNSFSFDFVGSESGTSGAGFGLYFTESESEAFTYGENIYECTLILKTNLSNTCITLKPVEIRKILDILKKGGENYYQNFVNDKNRTINNLLKYCDSDTEIIGDIINAGCGVHLMMETLTCLGYDHTIDEIESIDENIKHYIVYNINAIKLINKYNLDNR